MPFSFASVNLLLLQAQRNRPGSTRLCHSSPCSTPFCTLESTSSDLPSALRCCLSTSGLIQEYTCTREPELPASITTPYFRDRLHSAGRGAIHFPLSATLALCTFNEGSGTVFVDPALTRSSEIRTSVEQISHLVFMPDARMALHSFGSDSRVSFHFQPGRLHLHLATTLPKWTCPLAGACFRRCMIAVANSVDICRIADIVVVDAKPSQTFISRRQRRKSLMAKLGQLLIAQIRIESLHECSLILLSFSLPVAQ